MNAQGKTPCKMKSDLENCVGMGDIVARRGIVGRGGRIAGRGSGLTNAKTRGTEIGKIGTETGTSTSISFILSLTNSMPFTLLCR